MILSILVVTTQLHTEKIMLQRLASYYTACNTHTWYILHTYHRLARLLHASMRSRHHFMQAAYLPRPPAISRIPNYNNARWTFAIQIKRAWCTYLIFCNEQELFPESWTKVWSMSLSVSKFDDKFVNLNEHWMIHEIFCHKSVKFELTYGSCPKKKQNFLPILCHWPILK